MNVNLEMYIQIINPVTMRQNQCYFRLKKKIKGRRKKLKNRLKDKLQKPLINLIHKFKTVIINAISMMLSKNFHKPGAQIVNRMGNDILHKY